MRMSKSYNNFREYLKGRSKLKFAVLVMGDDKIFDTIDSALDSQIKKERKWA